MSTDATTLEAQVEQAARDYEAFAVSMALDGQLGLAHTLRERSKAWRQRAAWVRELFSPGWEDRYNLMGLQVAMSLLAGPIPAAETAPAAEPGKPATTPRQDCLNSCHLVLGKKDWCGVCRGAAGTAPKGEK